MSQNASPSVVGVLIYRERPDRTQELLLRHNDAPGSSNAPSWRIPSGQCPANESAADWAIQLAAVALDVQTSDDIFNDWETAEVNNVSMSIHATVFIISATPQLQRIVSKGSSCVYDFVPLSTIENVMIYPEIRVSWAALRGLLRPVPKSCGEDTHDTGCGCHPQ
ncbi:hypothetical protein F5B20DRAFT_593912 [Whalleya microplaca]|nr:hypothetical protein F5B20DRAFT_593912 [Whalleya microplaca]